MERRYETTNPSETEALGADLAASLKPGDVVLIAGELGSGKTTFVRGACRGLGVTGIVTSPTFTVGQRYPGPIPVSHIDLYRIEHLNEEEPDLLSDYLDAETITFIEWPRPGLAGVGDVAARVSIEHAGGEERVIEITRGSWATTPPHVPPQWRCSILARECNSSCAMTRRRASGRATPAPCCR
jgi:tRNA threonylcarbamoyladenosine biosynthesis protein TsaE